MFITTLNIPFIRVVLGLLLFSLSGLTRDILHRHALPGIHSYALRRTGNLRRVKYADEVVVDSKLLGAVLASALRLMDNNLLHKLVEDNRGPFLRIGMLFTVRKTYRARYPPGFRYSGSAPGRYRVVGQLDAEAAAMENAG